MAIQLQSLPKFVIIMFLFIFFLRTTYVYLQYQICHTNSKSKRSALTKELIWMLITKQIYNVMDSCYYARDDYKSLN